MAVNARVSDVWTFFRSFINSPQAVGSVLPSSRYLATAMVTSVDWANVDSVAEFGAGTGVITRAIDQSRKASSRFFCFEKDERLRQQLTRSYQHVDCYSDALMLGDVLRAQSMAGVDCIISGLPFANFKPVDRELLLRESYANLNPGGIFLAFQYSRLLQPFLATLYDNLDRRMVWANIPPAFIYICQKPRSSIDEPVH